MPLFSFIDRRIVGREVNVYDLPDRGIDNWDKVLWGEHQGASGGGGCLLPEDERISSRVPNIERSKILVGFWLLVETCHHSQLPSHLRRSGGVRPLWNIEFNGWVYGSGSTTHRLPSPTSGPRGPPV